MGAARLVGLFVLGLKFSQALGYYGLRSKPVLLLRVLSRLQLFGCSQDVDDC